MAAPNTKKGSRKRVKAGLPTKSPSYNDLGHGIVSENIEVDEEDTMIQETKHKVNDVISRSELSLDTTETGFVVGSPAGISFASHAEDVSARLQRLEDRSAKQDDHIAARDQRISAQDQRIATLEWSSHAFSTGRNRFISTAKRDKLGTATFEDLEIITSANEAFHGGNSKGDVKLYQERIRSDYDAYTAIYGLHPGVVGMIEYQPTLFILDRHATFVASSRYITTQRFHDVFASFIKAVQESNYAAGYLEGNPTSVTAAYWEFVRCLKSEVEVVKS